MNKNQFKIKTFKRKIGDIVGQIADNGEYVRCRVTNIDYQYNAQDKFISVATFEPVEPLNNKSNHRPLL